MLTPRIRVEALTPDFRAAALELAESLDLPLEGEVEFALQLGEEGLRLIELVECAGRASGDAAGRHLKGLKGLTGLTIRADFVSGRAAHRRQYGGGSRQMLAKAAGLRPGVRPNVLDATAGLGQDAFVLASLGCTVTLIERQAAVAALLEDGLRRALAHPETSPVAARMRFIRGDAIALMRVWREVRAIQGIQNLQNHPSQIAPQVVYLDPMFPSRVKTAQVKKEMRLFRGLVGDDSDAPALLDTALALASHRVVVKRPRKAPPVAGVAPAYALEGRSSRFDIYPKKSLSEK